MPLSKIPQVLLPPAPTKSGASVDNTGFSASPANNGGRLIRKDGIPNIRKTGLPWWQHFSMYHRLLRMTRFQFLGLVVLFYSTVNILFASLYFMLGPGHLSNTDSKTEIGRFMEAFFFSSQTLTTVGYGRVAPVGLPASAVAAIESLSGVLLFALVTGVVYARFARPRAYILFSDSLLVSPYKEGKALMIRLASYKTNHLTEAEAILTASMQVLVGDTPVSQFYNLKLETPKIAALPLNWTVVHAITEESPFWEMDEADLRAQQLEVFISIRAFDDHFSNTVQQRTSYDSHEMVWNARFLPMFQRDAAAGDTELMLDRVSAYERVALPAENA